MTFGQAFVGTWRAILRSRTLLSTMLLSVALYGFYYPAPYAHETAQRLPVIIVDQDNSALSRAMVRDLDATRAVEIVAMASDVAEARRRMRRGDADGVILVTQGLERQLRTGAPGAGIGVWVNATYLLRASTIGEAITSVVEGLAAERLLPGGQAVRAGLPIKVTAEPLFNRTGGYKSYVFPAVAVIIVQQTLLFGAATFMGGRRREGRWRMAPLEFIGSLAALASVGILNCLFLFGLIFWLQDVPTNENLPALLLAVPLFATAVAALGLWIGSFFDCSERAMVILAPTSVPLFFLTGTAWPLGQMPRFVQLLASLAPSTLGVHTFVPLNQMGASFSDVSGGMMLLAMLALTYGLAAGVRVTGGRSSR